MSAEGGEIAVLSCQGSIHNKLVYTPGEVIEYARSGLENHYRGFKVVRVQSARILLQMKEDREPCLHKLAYTQQSKIAREKMVTRYPLKDLKKS